MIRQITFLTLFLISCGTKDASKNSENLLVDTNLKYENQVSNEWEFEKIENSKLIFKNGKQFETKLNNLEYIGQICIENKEPFFIFSGLDCDNCDANPSIYIHSPSDGELLVGQGQNTYGLPGRIYSYENDSLLYESRVFYGQVLENRLGVIWYQSTLMNSGKWENSVFIAEIIEDNKVNNFLTDTVGLFSQTLSMLKTGLCKEIEGHDRTSEP